MPPASASTSSAARSSASRPSRGDAEQRHHAPERRARAHRAEQVLAVGDRVPADHDLVVDRLRDALAVERRDRAHERLGRAPGVEHLALADRARADRGAEVVVAADREHGAARLRQRVADRPERRPRERRLGQQARGRARPRQRLVPPPARVQVEPAGARGERELRALLAAEAVHDPLADAQPAHAARGLLDVVAQPAVLRDRPQRARGQPGGRAEGRDLRLQPRRLVLAARVVPGDRGDHRHAVAVEQHAGLGHARHADPGDAAVRAPARAPRARPPARSRRTPATRSPRRSAPASSAAAPGRARSPPPPG